MNRDSSIVRTDSRSHRIIAKENWGLTNDQMRGMHVHHRIPRSCGGTNDPSNLYVCSPSFHAYVWHGQDAFLSFVKVAQKGGRKGARALKKKIEQIKSLGQKWDVAQKRAKKMHDKHRGTPAYSRAQRIKSRRAAASKRSHWKEETYEKAWKEYVKGHSTGYLIAKALGEQKWKMYENMKKLFSLGYTFEQATTPDLFVAETQRLERSIVAHILDRYND